MLTLRVGSGVLLFASLGLSGCGSDEAGESTKGPADSGTESEASADASMDEEVDAPEPVDAADAAPQPVWEDPATSLMWQKIPKQAAEVWSDATKYCDGLLWAGYDDWRLPDIDELRSIVRGCPASEAGGACGVTASCLDESCASTSCEGCPGDQGPAQGCYWDSNLEGSCNLYWSSSADASSSLAAWYVGFKTARIRYDDVTLYHAIRCVRSGTGG